jgi:hypothetical protein
LVNASFEMSLPLPSTCGNRIETRPAAPRPAPVPAAGASPPADCGRLT